jgi:hypothetical protein
MKRALVNIVYGARAQEEHAITRANHKAYAEACRADYIAVEESKALPYGPAAKFTVVDIAKHYDQTLLLDIDTVVMRATMTPFDVTPAGYWGCVDELRLSGAAFAHQQQAWEQIAELLHEPVPPFRLNLNSGVTVLPKNCGAYLPPDKPLPEVWCIEQLWLSYQIFTRNLPFVRMDPRLNWCKWFTYFERGLSDAFIVHWNQRENRLATLQKLVTATHIK